LRFRIKSWDEELGTACTCGRLNCGHEGRVVWCDDPLVDDRSAERVWKQIVERNRPRRDHAVLDAEEFLRGQMDADGVIAMPAKDIFKAAKEEGHSRNSVLGAKEKLGLLSISEGFPAVVVRWEKRKGPEL